MEGITIPGVCPVCTVTFGVLEGLTDFGGRTAAFLFALGFALRFGAAFGFVFDLLMPGMVWPSCCANTSRAETRQNNRATNKTITRLNSENRPFITTSPLERSAAILVVAPVRPPGRFNFEEPAPRDGAKETVPRLEMRAAHTDLTLVLLLLHVHVARITTAAAAPIF